MLIREQLLRQAADAPHWAPPAMCEWEHYTALWRNIAEWLAKRM